MNLDGKVVNMMKKTNIFVEYVSSTVLRTKFYFIFFALLNFYKIYIMLAVPCIQGGLQHSDSLKSLFLKSEYGLFFQLSNIPQLKCKNISKFTSEIKFLPINNQS